MTDLPSFIPTGTLDDILGDVVSDELVATGAASTTVTFTANISPAEPFIWEGGLHRLRSTVTGVLDGTGITRKGGPIKLLANDAGLNFTGLQWHVQITTPGLPALKAFTFDAPADGETVDLATVTPVPAASPTGIVHGPAVDGVHRVGDTLVFTVMGEDITNPVNIGDLVLPPGDIDGGTPASSGSGTLIDGGTP